MGKITICNETTRNPISLIGEMAGICYNSNIEDQTKNYKRGLDCITSMHGRTTEFPDVYMIIDGYSARVIREFYTHIGGAPTRLQASTRYIDYEHGFDFVTPTSIVNNDRAKEIWDNLMATTQVSLAALDALGIPREDSGMGLPLAMTTKIVVKINARTLTDMSHARKCSRAYWEFRRLFKDIEMALSEYSPEWKEYVEMCFKPKCEYLNYCPEKKSCGYFEHLKK